MADFDANEDRAQLVRESLRVVPDFPSPGMR